MTEDKLVVAGKPYRSRLLVGTGKYKDFAETRAAIEASGAEIVTVAIRRTNIGQNANEPSLLEYLPPSISFSGGSAVSMQPHLQRYFCRSYRRTTKCRSTTSITSDPSYWPSQAANGPPQSGH